MLLDSVIRQFKQEADTELEINDYLLEPITGSFLKVNFYFNLLVI